MSFEKILFRLSVPLVQLTYFIKLVLYLEDKDSASH